MENNNGSGRLHHTDSAPANTDSIQMRNVVTEISANDSTSHDDSALSLLQMSRNTIMQGTPMGVGNAVCACDDVTCQHHPQHMQGFNVQHKYNSREKSGEDSVIQFTRYDPTCLEPMNGQICMFLSHVLQENCMILADLRDEEKMQKFKHKASNKGFDFIKWSQYDIHEMLNIDTMTTAYLLVQKYFSKSFNDDNLMDWRSFSPENVVRNYVYYYVKEVLDIDDITEIRTDQFVWEIQTSAPAPINNALVQVASQDDIYRLFNKYDLQLPFIRSRLKKNKCVFCGEKLPDAYIKYDFLLNKRPTTLKYCLVCQNS